MAPIDRSEARRERERGAALVEFALALPVLLLLVLGIIDFGRAYGAQQALIHATREGARAYAVTQVTSEAADAFWAGATSLDPARVNVSIPPDGCHAGEPIEVSASYDFQFIALPFTSINIGSEAVMRCGG